MAMQHKVVEKNNSLESCKKKFRAHEISGAFGDWPWACPWAIGFLEKPLVTVCQTGYSNSVNRNSFSNALFSRLMNTCPADFM